MTRCLIADDHPAVVQVLADAIAAAGFEIAGTAGDGPEALALVAADAPDCAIVDYRMPDLGGAELVARLRAAAPRMALVVYTAESSADVAAEVLAAGANAVVFKEAPLDDVLRAIDSALLGVPYLDPRMFAETPAPSVVLSPREAEVLSLIAEGQSYDEIARLLGIGAETCRTHLKKACLRLNAATRTGAVARALRLGLIG